MSVSVSDTTLTLMIILNYAIFSNYYWCRRISVRVISGVRVLKFLAILSDTYLRVINSKFAKLLFLSSNLSPNILF
jgi:hypothetical protein